MNSPASKPAADHSHHQPVGLRTAALTLVTSALWGGTPVAISYSVDTLPPVAVAGLRFAMAAVFMLFWCRVEGSELRLRAGQFRPSLIAGVLLFGQISLFNIGVQWSNSSHGTLLINTFIFWVVAIEHFITRGDRLTGRKLAGLVIAGSGAALVLVMSQKSTGSSAAGDAPSLAGDLVLLASAALLGVKTVFIKHALKVVEPGKLILWHDVFGVMLFTAYSLSMEHVTLGGFSTPAVLGLVYQGVFVAGLCFAIQAVLLRRHSASQIAVFSFATPLFGLVLAVLFRGDRLSPWLFVSAICVAIGILLVNSAPRRHDLSTIA